jgi:hypothetical protein
MPSGLRKTSGNHFEIYYEQPWGGVASNANPVDIQPNQFVTCQGVVALEGELCSVSVYPTTDALAFYPYVANAAIILMWTMLGKMYALDQFGNIYTNGAAFGFLVYVCTASDGPWTGISPFAPSAAVKVINGTAYITVMPRNSIYSYNGTTTFTLGSNYVGGLVLGILDDYLLMLNCNQASGGISSSMISWSGPGEFTTWNPSSNQLAGYNELATVDDQLTGFLSFSSVGIAISAKSLTEITPTGVGIGPFNFTSLWTAIVGQGSIYPLTITQYGQNGFLLTDAGAYSISASAGFSDISGAAKSSILASFQNPSLIESSTTTVAVSGNVVLNMYNSAYPNPYYILIAPSAQSNGLFVVWLCDIATQTWYTTTFDPGLLCNLRNGTTIPPQYYSSLNLTPAYVLTVQPIVPLGATFGSSYPSFTVVYFNLEYDGNIYSTVAPLSVYSSQNFNEIAQGIVPTNIVFRAEEIKLGRKPTIRRVIVKAYGTGVLTLTVSGKSFGTITLDGTTTPQSYITATGIYTGEDPQLSITSTTFVGSIIKVMLAGTYADGDID